MGEAELQGAVRSLVEIIQELCNPLKDLMSEMDWSAILLQKGLLTFFGLTIKPGKLHTRFCCLWVVL